MVPALESNMIGSTKRKRLAWDAISHFFGSQFAGTMEEIEYRFHGDWWALAARTQRGGRVVVWVGHLHGDDCSGPQEGSVDLFVQTPSRPDEVWDGGEYLFQVEDGKLRPMPWIRDARADLREWIREGVAA